MGLFSRRLFKYPWHSGCCSFAARVSQARELVVGWLIGVSSCDAFDNGDDSDESEVHGVEANQGGTLLVRLMR